MFRLASVPIMTKKANLFNNFLNSGALLLCSILSKLATLGGITSGPVQVISLSFAFSGLVSVWFFVADSFCLVFTLCSNKVLLLVSKRKENNLPFEGCASLQHLQTTLKSCWPSCWNGVSNPIPQRCPLGSPTLIYCKQDLFFYISGLTPKDEGPFLACFWNLGSPLWMYMWFLVNIQIFGEHVV